MAAWGCEFYHLGLTVSLTRSLRSLMRDTSALEDKIRIPARTSNILYLIRRIEKCLSGALT